MLYTKYWEMHTAETLSLVINVYILDLVPLLTSEFSLWKFIQQSTKFEDAVVERPFN